MRNPEVVYMTLCQNLLERDNCDAHDEAKEANRAAEAEPSCARGVVGRGGRC